MTTKSAKKAWETRKRNAHQPSPTANETHADELKELRMRVHDAVNLCTVLQRELCDIRRLLDIK
jgi:hypothetical protein